jgi:glyoxylate utilization-related uncharacterized protein
MWRKLANEAITEGTFAIPQVIFVLEGQLTIRMAGQTAAMSTGDVAFVPSGVPFQYWSAVVFTKSYLGASGSGLSDVLVKESEEWGLCCVPIIYWLNVWA